MTETPQSIDLTELKTFADIQALPKEQILELPISVLYPYITRNTRTIASLNVFFGENGRISDLLTTTASQLLRLPYVGRKSVRAFEQILPHLGFKYLGQNCTYENTLLDEDEATENILDIIEQIRTSAGIKWQRVIPEDMTTEQIGKLLRTIKVKDFFYPYSPAVPNNSNFFKVYSNKTMIEALAYWKNELLSYRIKNKPLLQCVVQILEANGIEF